MGSPQTVEEMASRLLDDSSLELLAHGEEDSSPNKRRATTPITLLRNGGDQAISPLDLPSPLEKPHMSSDNYSRATRVDKPSPRSPGRIPRRAATARVRRNTSQQRKSSGLQRPIGPTRTLSLDPLKFHPTDNLKASTSVPLSNVDRNVRNRATGNLRISSIREECTGGEDINDKLLAMLAATDALKPSPQRANSSSSRFTRMVPSKVLAKVSNAWDRFHPKPSPQEKASQTKIPSGEEDNCRLVERQAAPSPPSPSNMSPISTIEIRLNEGDNLNKRKVQRIVGGRVNRKPLADDGKSLRNGKPIEDPFAEGMGWRTPTTFESRLKIGAEEGERAIPPLPCNPFESEKEFDNNIEDRFLISTPVGSSTPRIRVERTSTSSSEYSPTVSATNLAHKQVSMKLGSPPLRFGRGGLIRKGTWIDSVTEARQAWEKSAGDFDAFGSNRMKKHPSPSKEVLENLEMAFRQYTHLKVSGAKKYDLDELTTGFMVASPSLKPYEKKMLSLTHLSVSNVDELVEPPHDRIHHRRGSSASMLQLARNQYSLQLQNPIKLRRDIRLAPPYRPAGFSPLDVDELH
ncbi:hypothetical protein FSARC_3474 [Fusarium sarcochroum]|uniref:Uncharacterized protein n=1 Tax=Fusarium sarcochroum TaxID=1208366 RepID=A0A8H4U3U7_9HYPO|nr:hypothetical protein FSARC_3474 [Fusarium sarcochroum]